ncbi:MAG: DUF4129 domain-containing protein, partial [Streptomycetaceae bacterium]|nr:DUF4129 domain-containing protein [Streptomycetaceae bacterium]
GPLLPPGATTGDIVTHATTHAGPTAAQAARAVADAADAIAFGAQTASEELADACTAHARTVRAEVKSAPTTTPHTRTAARLHPAAIARTFTAVRTARRQD